MLRSWEKYHPLIQSVNLLKSIVIILECLTFAGKLCNELIQIFSDYYQNFQLTLFALT